MLPMITIVVLVFAALIVGNGVLNATTETLRAGYVDSLSGDLSVGPISAGSNFTLFGSDQLLVGDYIVPPTIPKFQELRNTVVELPSVQSTAGLVTATAQLEIGEGSSIRTVLGVDFDDYLLLFPNANLDIDEPPPQGTPWVLLRPGDASKGRTGLLSSQTAVSFTIREVPIIGTVDFPIGDEAVDRIILTDVDTARALNGYRHGANAETELTRTQAESTTKNLDDLFGSADGAETNSESLDLDRIFESDYNERNDMESDRAASQTMSGAWNFLLIRLEDDSDAGSVIDAIESAGYTPSAGYRLRRWYETVGGNAILMHFLQVFFNIGLVFVAIGAAIIATNALVLAVLERRKEIGTMRALGASKIRVSILILGETFCYVMGAAIIGIIGGLLFTTQLNNAEFVIANRYISMLFGGQPIRGELNTALIALHLLGALALSIMSSIYPLKQGLGVVPQEAMVA